MFVSLIPFLVLSPLLAFSYNVDKSDPIVYEDQEPGRNGYFGYTVALRSGRDPAASASIFIGAPKCNQGEGALYRCSVNENEASANSCRKLETDQASISNRVSIRGYESASINRVGTIGWLGASLATRESSNLTVCAPRTTFRYAGDDDFTRDNIIRGITDDMRGVCYNLPEAIGDTLYRDNSVLSDSEYLHGSRNTLYGFAINYAAKKDPDTVELIIGIPTRNRVEIHHENKTETRRYPGLGRSDAGHALADAAADAYLGYSIASGYFFHPEELVFAAGMPAWNLKGQVVVDLPGTTKQTTTIHGSVLGEYFGASLTTGDFDNDGLDDIAVGAPHWGEVDYGRVYTFYGNDKGVFREGLMLQGTAEYGQFGYTLAASDLDSDGYADLVVGAPWEASGAIYIFYGQREFQTKGGCTPITQRIVPSEFKSSVPIQGFGFSLAIPVDVDENGYPDLAVGAYKSGHAILLRSRPVIKVTPHLVSYPRILERSTRSLVIGICVGYHGKRAPETQDFRVEIAADEEYMRIENNGSVKFFTAPFSLNETSCVNKTLHLRTNFQNFAEPIIIRGKFSISEEIHLQGVEFRSHCPVLDKGYSTEEAELLIPFNTNCKNDKVCNSNLSISWFASGVSNNDQWVVGSEDVNFNIRVTNNGEPAFQAQITIEMPSGVRLRKAIQSCMESKQGNSVVLECGIGNPLLKGEPKSLAVDLDMGGIASSAGGTVLPFTVTTKTWSVDHGEKRSVFSLRLINRAYITLTGVANEENHEYGNTGNDSKLSIRQIYKLVKKGPSSLPKVHFAVDVPVAITEKNVSIVDIHLPELDSYGNIHNCQITDTKKQEKKNEKLQEGKTSIDGQDIDRTIYVNCSTAGFTCRTVTCDVNITKTSDSVEYLILDMVFHPQPLLTSDGKFFIVNFSTNVQARIEEPVLLDTMNGSRSVKAKASTMIYKLPEAQKLAGWVLPLSLCVGLLSLVILVIILLKVGFFNRTRISMTEKAQRVTVTLRGDDGDDELDHREQSS